MKFIKAIFIITVLSALFAKRVLSAPLEIEPYGFLKASIMYGTDPILSFNNVNMVAPTAAVNHNSYSQGNDRTAFQVAQSRLGTHIKAPQKFQGTVEIDFVDFSQSSPTTQTRPRLRRVFIEKQFENSLSIQIGQDWDTFSPLRPDTFDIIGLYFNGGNIGFMREQLKIKKKFKKTSVEFSVGQSDKNATLGNNEIEEDNQLSAAFNSKFFFSEGHTIAIAAITGKANYADTQSKNPYAFSLGYQYQTAKTKLVFESYYGRGLSKLNVLDLPGGNYGQSLGGYVTLQRELQEDLFLRVGQGYAKRNKAGVSTINANKAYTNLGLKENIVSRVAIAKRYDQLQAYTELSHFISDYGQSSSANSFECGFILPF